MREWRLPRLLARAAPAASSGCRVPPSSGVRIIVSAALLALLITKIPADDVQPKDTHTGTLLFLAFGLLLTLVGFVLSAWRWQRVLAVFDAHVPLRTLLGHYLAGQFVGNVLPSTIGGDVLRVSRAAKTTGTSDIAFASVVIERLSGFVALPAPHAARLRDRAVAPRASTARVDRARDRRRHARRPRRHPVRRRQPPPRRPLRQARELDALHRRGARRRRPHPPRAPPGR